MIDYFIDYQPEGGHAIHIESIEVINADLEQVNDIINDLECMLHDLNKHRDFLKEQ